METTYKHEYRLPNGEWIYHKCKAYRQADAERSACAHFARVLREEYRVSDPELESILDAA